MIIQKLEIRPNEKSENFRHLVLTSEKHSGLGQVKIEMIVSLGTMRMIHNQLAEALGYEAPKTIFDLKEESKS